MILRVAGVEHLAILTGQLGQIEKYHLHETRVSGRVDGFGAKSPDLAVISSVLHLGPFKDPLVSVGLWYFGLMTGERAVDVVIGNRNR